MIEVSKISYYLDDNDRARLKEFLKKKDMDMCSLSKELDISQSLLSLIVSGKRPIKQYIIENLEKNGFKLPKCKNLAKNSDKICKN